MSKATIIFTKRKYNVVSWIIRWALPATRFRWARASHSMILDGDHVIHATMTGGVIRQPYEVAMKHQTIVTVRDYTVHDREAGIAWAMAQVGKSYDFKGAFGVALEPDREWREDDSWFCHELSAGFLNACGKRAFSQFGHVTDTALLLINPA